MSAPFPVCCLSWLSVCVCLYLWVCLCFPVAWPASMPVNLYAYLSLFVCTLHMCLSVCCLFCHGQFACLLICQPACLLTVCMVTCACVHAYFLFDCLHFPICDCLLPVYLFIFLFGCLTCVLFASYQLVLYPCLSCSACLCSHLHVCLPCMSV